MRLRRSKEIGHFLRQRIPLGSPTLCRVCSGEGSVLVREEEAGSLKSGASISIEYFGGLEAVSGGVLWVVVAGAGLVLAVAVAVVAAVAVAAAAVVILVGV